MSEYNERYIGEVFIDGKSNKLLQEFLTNLFNAYNGPGKGFNADMLDDWHRDDFIQYIDDGLATKLDYIKVGQTIFNKSNPENYITLYDSIYGEEFEGLPWVYKIKTDANGDKYHRGDSSCFDDELYLAIDVILDIYAVLDADKAELDRLIELEEKHDELEADHQELKEDYHAFKERFAHVFKRVKILDEDGNEIETCLLNADLINGFRIIPITQAAYNALPDSQKDYWRNIYIIVDEVPDEYEDPIQFKVLEGIKLVYNPETQYIDYYNGISPDPKPLISLVDLLSGANFNQHIRNFLENTGDIIYNLDAFKETLRELSISDSEAADFDFLTKKEASILASSITVGSNYGTITSTDNTKGFKTFDISNAFSKKFSEIATQLNNRPEASYIASHYVNQATYNTDIPAIRQSISTLDTRVSADIINIKEEMYRSGLIAVIGRWYDEGGELGSRLQLYNNNPNAGNVANGLYVRVLSTRPIDHTKLNIIIDLEPLQKAYTFNTNDNDGDNVHKIVDSGKYHPFGKDANGNYIGPEYYSAKTTMLGINQPSWEKGKKFMVFAIVRYGNDAFPISAMKRIEII